MCKWTILFLFFCVCIITNLPKISVRILSFICVIRSTYVCLLQLLRLRNKAKEPFMQKKKLSKNQNGARDQNFRVQREGKTKQI